MAERTVQKAKSIKYFIDIEASQELGKSIAVTIAARLCYSCRQIVVQESVIDSNPQDHIDRIVEQCSGTQDYLLPDTPLKEAIFRLILANGNHVITAEEVSEGLAERWATSTYQRDVSPQVVGRILAHSESYSVVPYVDR